MIIYGALSIDSKPKKSTKMSVIYKLKSEWQKSNHHIAGVFVNIHTKYEVSMIGYVSKRANQWNQWKVPK